MFFNQRARAMKALESALAIDQSDTAAKNALGLFYGETGRFPLAAEQFQSALRDEPRNANTLFNLGFVQQKQDAHLEAIKAFDAALQINPAIDRAWFGRGISRAALGRHEQAVGDFEHAAKLQPMNPHALFELGMQHYALGNQDRVIETINRLLEFDPKAARELMRASHAIVDGEQS
jgi:tetratricopeptide (TPR) repeat protein